LEKIYIQQHIAVVCTPDAGSSARKAPENVCRPDSARTRWGAEAPPRPLAAKSWEMERRGRKGKGGKG